MCGEDEAPEPEPAPTISRHTQARSEVRHVYLHAYDSVSEARIKLATYLDFYNRRRPHTALDGRRPDDVYFNSLPQQQAA